MPKIKLQKPISQIIFLCVLKQITRGNAGGILGVNFNVHEDRILVNSPSVTLVFKSMYTNKVVRPDINFIGNYCAQEQLKAKDFLGKYMDGDLGWTTLYR